MECSHAKKSSRTTAQVSSSEGTETTNRLHAVRNTNAQALTTNTNTASAASNVQRRAASLLIKETQEIPVQERKPQPIVIHALQKPKKQTNKSPTIYKLMPIPSNEAQRAHLRNLVVDESESHTSFVANVKPLQMLMPTQAQRDHLQALLDAIAPDSSNIVSPMPIPSNEVQRARLQALPTDKTASSSSSAFAGASSSISTPLNKTPSPQAVSYSLMPTSLCAASKLMIPSPKVAIPEQNDKTWQTLFLDVENAKLACLPIATLNEIPNAPIAPWRNPLHLYLFDIKYAINEFIQFAKSNTANRHTFLLKNRLEKAIEVGQNIHPFLLEMTYKLAFYQHPFNSTEVEGLRCFLTAELAAFKNNALNEKPSNEYQQWITHLNSYLNSICKEKTIKKKSFLFGHSKRESSFLAIKNPSREDYTSIPYLNNKTVLAMRRYIAMNTAFLDGYLKVTENAQIADDAKFLIEKIITQNIESVADVALLFTPKNLINHYANYLSRRLDRYYKLTPNCPENLKSHDENKRRKIQKLIRIMLAKLISEDLDVSHFESCLKSPFHLAKDGLGNNDFALKAQYPELSETLTMFQRSFMETFLNDLNQIHISLQTSPVYLSEQKEENEQAAQEGINTQASYIRAFNQLFKTECSVYGTPLSERSLAQGFDVVLRFFAEKNLDMLLSTEPETLWKEIKTRLIPKEQ